LYYIGHSMGTTTFFIAMAERPEYNKKVKLMSALAPVTLMENTRSLLVRLVLPLLPYFTNTSVLPYTEILNIESIAWLTKLLCNADTPTQPLCSAILGFIGGFNPPQLDLINLPKFMEHSPAGSSSKVFFHYGQNIVSGDFKQYDYGEEKNMEIYGQMTPPPYDFSKITASTAMYYGENDLLADRIVGHTSRSSNPLHF
jgi:lysosomal acid lipase/cholesteryl ester hydrolase